LPDALYSIGLLLCNAKKSPDGRMICVSLLTAGLSSLSSITHVYRNTILKWKWLKVFTLPTPNYALVCFHDVSLHPDVHDEGLPFQQPATSGSADLSEVTTCDNGAFRNVL